jgi:amino-acid N-acetyltransferase
MLIKIKMFEYIIKKATSADADKIKLVLKNTNLPYKDIDSHLENFFFLEKCGEIIGTAGLEVYGEVALLRSLAVIKEYQNKRLGQKLYQNIFIKALSLNIKEIYLLTETAEKFFARKGFKKISRDSAPATIQHTNEFRILCPDSAVCMVINLCSNDKGKIYERSI